MGRRGDKEIAKWKLKHLDYTLDVCVFVSLRAEDKSQDFPGMVISIVCQGMFVVTHSRWS